MTNKNIHLIPQIILDITLQLDNPSVRDNERLALIQRIEAIRDCCIKTLSRDQRKQEDSKRFNKVKIK
jgi:hypothetical protein